MVGEVEADIVASVRIILLELYRLVDLGVDRRRIDRIQRETLFFLYEGGEGAKWAWERPHSAAARELHRQARASGRAFRSGTFPITYEHCIPLATIREGLKSASADLSTLTDFLYAHIAGVVVTKEEDQMLRAAKLDRAMPVGAAANDRLARYLAAGIELEPDDIHRLRYWPRLDSRFD